MASCSRIGRRWRFCQGCPPLTTAAWISATAIPPGTTSPVVTTRRHETTRHETCRGSGEWLDLGGNSLLLVDIEAVPCASCGEDAQDLHTEWRVGDKWSRPLEALTVVVPANSQDAFANFVINPPEFFSDQYEPEEILLRVDVPADRTGVESLDFSLEVQATLR